MDSCSDHFISFHLTLVLLLPIQESIGTLYFSAPNPCSNLLSFPTFSHLHIHVMVIATSDSPGIPLAPNTCIAFLLFYHFVQTFILFCTHYCIPSLKDASTLDYPVLPTHFCLQVHGC